MYLNNKHIFKLVNNFELHVLDFNKKLRYELYLRIILDLKPIEVNKKANYNLNTLLTTF